MGEVSLADAKARLSELVADAEAGRDTVITRRGKPVARLVAVTSERKPIDIEELRQVTRNQPLQTEDAATFIRRMRDEARY